MPFASTALTFALLAYAADREKHYTFAAMLAAGAWLFAGIFVLICVVLWVWR
jgi:tellurite resistance protein TehA-like permease